MFNDPNPTDTDIDNANLASQKSNSSISISNINQLHKTANNTDEEDEKKWQHLMENHHEQCDFEKCAGKRTNGLYVCQYSNIPGSMYSQFLRYRRRQGAYKTKPCRNFYGGGYCHAGDQCSFYHTLAEQRNMPPDLAADYDNSIQSMHHGFMVHNSGDGSSSAVGGSNNNGLLYYNHNHHPRNGVGNFGLFNEIGHGHGFNGEQLPINLLLDGLCKQVDTTVHKLYKHVFANYENMNPNFYNFTGGPSTADVFNGGTVNFVDGKKMRQDTNIGTDEAGKMVQTIQMQPYNLNLGGERWPPFSSMDNMSVGVAASAPIETQVTRPDFAAAFYHHVGVDNSTSASPGVIGFSRAVGANVGNNNKNANSSSHGAAKQRHFSAGQLDFGKSFHPFGESYPLKDTGISIGALNNE